MHLPNTNYNSSSYNNNNNDSPNLTPLITSNVCSYCYIQQHPQQQLAMFCRRQHYFCPFCINSLLQCLPAICPLCILETRKTDAINSEENAYQPPFIATISANITPNTNGTIASPNSNDYFYADSTACTRSSTQTYPPPSVYLPTTNIYQPQQMNHDSYYLVNNSNSIVPLNFSYACVKLSNIPWDISQKDVRSFFGNCHFPSATDCIQSIHIMMDRNTGKTLSDAYIEFTSIADMRRAMHTRNQRPLKGRIISVVESSQEEILKAIFPKWRGQFDGTNAIPPPEEVVRTMSTAAGGGTSACPPFITREEINSIVVVCKNYKLHFSRKCAERPFENIISIIAKYPWHQAHLITNLQRDHLYEMLKTAIEALKTHLFKECVQIDPTLMVRLVRAGVMCPAFTARQKTTLLQTARMQCPQDIVHRMLTDFYPVHSGTATSLTNHAISNIAGSLYSGEEAVNSSSDFYGCAYPSTPQPLSNHNCQLPPAAPLAPYYQSTAAFYQSVASKIKPVTTRHDGYETITDQQSIADAATTDRSTPFVERKGNQPNHYTNSRRSTNGNGAQEEQKAIRQENCSGNYEPDNLPFASLIIDIQKCSSYSTDDNYYIDCHDDDLKEGDRKTDQDKNSIKNSRNDLFIRPSHSSSIIPTPTFETADWTLPPSFVPHTPVEAAKIVDSSSSRLQNVSDNRGLPVMFTNSRIASSYSTSILQKPCSKRPSTVLAPWKSGFNQSKFTGSDIWRVAPSYNTSTSDTARNEIELNCPSRSKSLLAAQ
ncbi:hypothetical protein BDF20DRAFT_909719 [Mycotypha africana]|uniref:uncharacterized protein n=1 Tax=Mycotypha africana TaxID=64632 RepID=UPI002300AE3E|nr:uncharacterized protein BDF20DRAFT_909719 [Mycotypha africana]KAI8992028.1 hypothetical protein BDF20DRAFT_909719 [Mycotypha africana]